MNSILIVEDDDQQRRFLEESAMACNNNIRIYSTDQKSESMNIILENEINAFFIDIQLTDGNGIDLAKEIRNIKQYQFTPIVFITGVLTRELEVFHNIHCYDYILKPYIKESITEVMNRILVDFFQKEEKYKYLNLEFKGIKQRINIKDIVLIESKNRKIFIRTIFEEIRYKQMNISQIANKLPDQFIQVHQSILVNSNYIEKINLSLNHLRLKCINEKIPIGVSYRKKMREQIDGFF